jgi:sec-independent protein translocase protein TatB
MPSFADNIFLVILALLLFGPKKLPMLARELGKWVGEFRRASNEFKMQMEEELRLSEQADRQQKIAAMEAAAPAAPLLTSETPEATSDAISSTPIVETENIYDVPDAPSTLAVVPPTAEGPKPLPIATAGDLSMMPPDTGLPVARSKSNPLASLVDSIPTADPTESISHLDPSTEPAAHAK